MAGVDHAFQYSVEVKSRFSLFLDDSLNSEDPDLLLSKIQSKRSERSKKEKQHAVQQPEAEKPESAPKEELKPETPAKAKVVRVPKLPKHSPSGGAEEIAVDSPPKDAAEPQQVTATRGRGTPRGYSRGFRGGRGFYPKAYSSEGPRDSSGNQNAEAVDNRDTPYEPRGRGRGRGQGGYGRGRGGSYADHQEYGRGAIRSRGRGGYGAGPRTATDEEPATPVTEVGDSSQPEAEAPETPVEAEENVADDEPEQTAEEEPKSYTLEEYKAMRSSAKPAITLTTKGARKANDGKDVFANMVAHRKLNEVSDEEVEEVEKEPEEPQTFDIDVSFTDRFGDRGARVYNNRGFERGRGSNFRGRPRGERGARGGRGTFRGEGRGRGFSRGMPSEHHAPPPAIYSDQDFPSLK